MTYTENYNLALPAGTDPASITPLNRNATMIDGYLKDLQDQIDEGGGGIDIDVIGEGSGSLVTFADGSGLPLKSMTVDIEAQQDLHGYDKPWSGGNGKNKLPLILDDIKDLNTSGVWNENAYTVNGITFTVLTDSGGNVTGIKLNGTSTSGVTFNLFNFFSIPFSGSYKFIGISNFASGVAALTCDFSDSSQVNVYQATIMESKSSNLTHSHIYIWNNRTFNNATIYPMVMLASVTDSTFEPYSNICPIEGFDDTTIEVSDGDETTIDTTITFEDTVYSGQFDPINGTLTVTHANIPSYNGETINEPWISSMDEYVSGTTPTTGAQVVYPLTNPQTYQLTPQQIATLIGTNNISADGLNIDLEYIKGGDFTDAVKAIIDVTIGQSNAILSEVIGE